MNKFKKFFAGALAGTMILSLAACGSSSGSTSTATDTAATSTTSVAAEAESTAEETTAAEGTYATPETDWEISSGIYNTDETDEELYELAKEEGSVTIYSISSRTPKVVEAFNEKYPGVVAESYDIKTNELLEKVTREHEAGQNVADVVHVKDEDGTIWNEYIPQKIFYNYKPADILSHIDSTYTETQTPLYIELTQFFYNTEAYPDGCPITNIWELTNEEWKGRIVMQNPLDNTSWNAWVTGFTVGDVPEQLEAAYKELYGEDLVLSSGCENAGYELWKRIYDNEPIFASSSDECAEAIGAKGQENPPVGFSASSKIRKNADNDWVLGAANLYPTIGIPAVNTLYVVEGCEHPNAAKLLIRYMMGGVDGDLSGYEPFNTLGGWPVRDDIDPAEGSTPLSEYNVATADAEEIYMNVQNVRDFLTMLG